MTADRLKIAGHLIGSLRHFRCDLVLCERCGEEHVDIVPAPGVIITTALEQQVREYRPELAAWLRAEGEPC